MNRLGQLANSSRGDTPEPGLQQGHRNTFGTSHGRTVNVQLLDDEGDLTLEFETCLAFIFSKYCTPEPTTQPLDWLSASGPDRPAPPPLDWIQKGAYISDEALDRWAIDTNGAPLSEAVKEEIKDSIDTDDDGHLTFAGMLQIYQLQTSMDEEETWRDLASHGFDRNLELAPTRREDLQEPPADEHAPREDNEIHNPENTA
ncbi:hypothetical protein DACRYDRAFT_19913 [Dacryopinax primogenitus]|uniref:EF-hand domain-containing protein n=1 Tax=Dacryopinax primogenitus (strain DJM 731) TaxID=1858805 RepID=M5G9E2_DACPD|nr:uncharacterized protein DACRYDRAFT_19913 [Dacryopinax primogenitus]EJU05409.1 hypothetical protein DACRYDRAFT_19913 [Dacryopinax primogenitus]